MSSWQHPLFEVFLSTLESLALMIRQCESVADLAQALKEHLSAADEEAARKLEGAETKAF